MKEEHWQGALWLGPDYCLLAGVSGNARPHAHYAHQLLLATEEPLRLLVEGQAHCARALLVPSQQEHAFELAGQPLLALYAEPLSFSLEQLQVWPPRRRPSCRRCSSGCGSCLACRWMQGCATRWARWMSN